MKSNALRTFLIVAGIFMTYVILMSPTPVLSQIREDFGIESEALLNMVVSVVYFSTVIGSVAGGSLISNLGLTKTFTILTVCAAVGSGLSLAANSVFVLIAARFIYGFGFGTGINFIGFALIAWYHDKERERMSTANGMFGFFGSITSFATVAPLASLFGGSWRASLAIWAVPLILVSAIWMIAIKPGVNSPRREMPLLKSFTEVVRIHDARLLGYAFIFDFFCYSYMATVLPTYICLQTGKGDSEAGIITALALPGVAIIGGLIAGVLVARGVRRLPLILGQFMKVVAIIMLAVFMKPCFPLAFIGIALYGLGDGLWLPGFYVMITEQEGMSPPLAGAAFALISSVGYIAGFISPLIGGAVSSAFAGFATTDAARAFGMEWALAIFSITNAFSGFCIIRCKETRPQQ